MNGNWSPTSALRYVLSFSVSFHCVGNSKSLGVSRQTDCSCWSQFLKAPAACHVLCRDCLFLSDFLTSKAFPFACVAAVFSSFLLWSFWYLPAKPTNQSPSLSLPDVPSLWGSVSPLYLQPPAHCRMLITKNWLSSRHRSRVSREKSYRLIIFIQQFHHMPPSFPTRSTKDWNILCLCPF